jgi:type II secretory pathway component PulF
MATFVYKGIDENGNMVNGTIDSTDLAYATQSLSVKNLFILKITPVNNITGRISFLSGKVTRRDVIEFARNMSSEMRAGIPMLDALEDIALATDKKALKDAVFDLKDRIMSGSTLSDALSANGKAFPDILPRMTKIGEETGRLELSLVQVADHLQRIDDLSGTIKRALMYPIFILIVISAALIFWLVYVMPKMLAVIKDMGVAMPLPTRIMLAISNGAQLYWYVVPIILIGFFLLLRAALKQESFRYYFDRILMNLPIVKSFINHKRLASFAEQTNILIVAGITIDRALDIVANSIGSEVFKRAILHVKEKILSGSRISDAIRQESVFPKMVARLVDVGETAGSLSDQFHFLSTFHGKRLDDTSERLSKMIEPVMMAVVGIIFIFMIMAILLPMYEVIGKMK